MMSNWFAQNVLAGSANWSKYERYGIGQWSSIRLLQ